MDLQIKTFIKHCTYEKILATKTLNFYTIDLKQFDTYLINHYGSNEIIEINKEHIRNYVEHIGSFKPKTIKRKIATLKSFFSFCEFEDFISSNPFRKLKIRIKESVQCPKTITLENIETILEYAYHEYEGSKNILALRDIIVIELLFSTGIRVSELSNLKSIDISAENHSIKVMGKGSRERIIHIPNIGLLQLVINYKQFLINVFKELPQYFLLNRNGNKLSDQSIRIIVKKCSKNISEKGYVTPHTFRHSLATLLIESNVDVSFVQKLLGHSSIVTTQIYTHISQNKQNEVLAKNHPRQFLNIINKG